LIADGTRQTIGFLAFVKAVGNASYHNCQSSSGANLAGLDSRLPQGLGLISHMTVLNLAETNSL